MMPLQDQLGAALCEDGLVDASVLERAREIAAKTGQRLGKVLAEIGVVSQEQVYQAYSKVSHLPLWDGEGEALTDDERFGHDFLTFNHVLPVAAGEKKLLVIDDPEDDGLIEMLRRMAPDLELALAPPNRLAHAMDSGLGLAEAEAEAEAPTLNVESLKDMALEAPIIRKVNDLIGAGIEMSASDIHLEPFKNRIELRYRMDGVLHNRPSPSVDDYPAVVSRIKILAGLDIAERRVPQDGRIRIKGSGRDVDIRVSTIPTLHGEDVVLRLLDQKKRSLGLEVTELSPGVIGGFRDALGKSHGLFVVSGPTGSGKTTTLYSGLQEIVDGRKKIITVENPVEYEIAGVNQIQVNEAAGMTFANLLRSILRHDPDVIFIGEIRDKETAEIAVQASLTGHLVLSTIHTNSATGAIGRLLDMEIPDYLLASSMIAVSAQRLLRRLCPHCRRPTRPDEVLRKRYNIPDSATVYEPGECKQCAKTGYAGRIPIGEFLPVDAELRHEILQNPSSDNLLRAARARGFVTLLEDGIAKVSEGLTTIDEVLRVAS
jgi:general secretion pathway protein E